MVIAGRIQRYVFVAMLNGLAVTLGVILLAILLVDVVEQMRTIGGRTEIGLETAFQLTLLKTPLLIQETLPFAMLVGAILAFSKLSRTSELPAIRAAGVSAWRFLGPAMLVAFLVGVVAVTIVDPLATRANAQFENMRSELLSRRTNAGIADRNGVWLRQGDENGQSVIHAESTTDRADALLNVEIFIFDRTASGPGGDIFEFSRRIDAERAELRPGFWQLERVIENTPGGEPVRQEYLALPTTLEPETLLNRFASAKSIAFWDLPKFISDTRRAGLDDNQYVLKYHTLLATPFLLTAMAMIGAVVCLRLARS
ncbi:MAG: LptF/LptG family permease, partial [Pseudomonadota bacterium]